MGLEGETGMSDTSVQDFYTKQADRGPRAGAAGPAQAKARKRLKRIVDRLRCEPCSCWWARWSGGGYLVVNHEASNVPRIHVAALDAKTRLPVWRGTGA